MRKKYYKFNPRTLTYEAITIPFRIRFYRLLRKLIAGFILALIVNLIFSYFFYTPKMAAIKDYNNELLIKYDILADKIQASTEKIKQIKQRDVHVYRVVFASDSIQIPGIYTPYSPEKYAELQGDRYSTVMTRVWMDLDALSRMVYKESKSLDDLEVLAHNKEQMAESIPAIWPINRKYVRGSIGAFGMRRHPIYGRYIMHEGIDFGGPRGTPIYATGNARVTYDTGSERGYGRQVVLDHGYGYKTRYAHLSRISVVPGQIVKRGEKIGELGNTGQSTGPHLHYEVIYRGKHLNPINFMSRDMTEEDMMKIIESAKTTTFEPL